jgi:tellurite resistance protein TehA-like permease
MHGAAGIPDTPSFRPARLGGELPGGGFAFVMATGIVSIAASLDGLPFVALPLLAINIAAYPILWALLFRRLLRDRAGVLAELADHRSAAGFLTLVAGTGVLGNQLALLVPRPEVVALLWIAALLLWIGLVYCFFLILAIQPEKPSLAAGIDGSWLLVTVATEATAILGTHAAGGLPWSQTVLYSSLCLFLLGGFFYLTIILLIIYRWLFAALGPEEVTPSYWINMGAVAIATLTGARLELVSHSDPLLAGLAPVITMATLLFWAIATWWLPLLTAMAVWRHLVRRVPLQYRFDHWSAVFPLGMYTVATANVADILSLGLLAAIARVFVWIALASWLAACAGMLRHRLAPRNAAVSSPPRMPPACESGSDMHARNRRAPIRRERPGS